MPTNSSARVAPPSAETVSIDAGNFSSWLADARSALIDGRGSDVDCGGCVGCCSSSYFIHIRPDESLALARLPGELLAPAPGMACGDQVLGYDEKGRCPMLCATGCSIYDERPRTCRAYDCRLFAAAGIAAGGVDKAAINQRLRRWKFSYPTARDRQEQRAVKAVVTFVEKHAGDFPGGRVPTNPSQLAVLAIKAYAVFMSEHDASEATSSNSEVAQAVIAACRLFDARIRS